MTLREFIDLLEDSAENKDIEIFFEEDDSKEMERFNDVPLILSDSKRCIIYIAKKPE